jgi:hypothetical protein
MDNVSLSHQIIRQSVAHGKPAAQQVDEADGRLRRPQLIGEPLSLGRLRHLNANSPKHRNDSISQSGCSPRHEMSGGLAAKRQRD